MQTAPKTYSEYSKEIDEALHDEQLRKTMGAYAVVYRTNRANVMRDIDEKALIKQIADFKDDACAHMEELYQQFKEQAEKRGVHVHRAIDAAEANQIISDIAKAEGVKRIVKSKSMTSEETQLNDKLVADGYIVDETDLGEWIIQLRHEHPSHMVMPAIHLSRFQIAEDFSKVTQVKQDPDIQRLVKVARVQLRRKFLSGDMGITGCNFAIAECGAITTVTNEGNARMVETMPRVHTVLVGLDKLVRRIDDAMIALQILPRNATAQRITSYVTWVCGPTAWKGEPAGQKSMHIVFLDNGRTKTAKDPIFKQVFRCVRCGACTNVCPVFTLIGGHKMGYIYMGAIGLILTYLYHGEDKAKILCQNCVGCESCHNVCSGGIDLPRLNREIRNRLVDDGNGQAMGSLMKVVMTNRKMFHSLLRFASKAQKPFTAGTQFQRHLPMIFLKKHDFKALPAIADKAFRDMFPNITPKVDNPVCRVAIFAGCAQDFIYPEQLVAAVKVMAAKKVAVDFPMDQTCCGLPLGMMGQRKAVQTVARQNVRAFADGNYDYIITLCASCGSTLKKAYADYLENDPDISVSVLKKFQDKVIDFSSFCTDVLDIEASDFVNTHEKVTFHGSCHQCRALKAADKSRELIRDAAEYVPCNEEEVCCGFGGTYSVKFPEISKEIIAKKVKNIQDTNADRIVMDCPGCVLQIKGALEKANSTIKVSHLSELIAENLAK
ncbi:MAG: LUD domain-containing protein [Desulfovibrionaceae bacterium]|nr:LUD domain-containing protein [Desulfovibrionaceae bacterium]